MIAQERAEVQEIIQEIALAIAQERAQVQKIIQEIALVIAQERAKRRAQGNAQESALERGELKRGLQRGL